MRISRKHQYLLLFLILLLPFLGGGTSLIGLHQTAFAALPLDNQSSSNGSSSWSHTVGNQPNRILLVGSNGNVSSVKYNDQSLINVISSTNGSATNSSIWYLLNPPVGTYTVTVVGERNSAGAVTLYNIDQSTPLGNKNAIRCSNGNICIQFGGQSIKNDILFTNSNQIVFDVVNALISPPTATLNPASGQTVLWSRNVGVSGGRDLSAGAIQSASFGLTSVAWNIGDPNGQYQWEGVIVAINLLPVVPPTPTPTPTPAPGNGNIVNLNFGISNFRPWLQGTCGNMRLDNGINNPIPATAQGGAYMVNTNASCSSPGVLYGGAGTIALGQGQVSSSNWVVGGSSYPEVHGSTTPATIATSHANMSSKVQRGGITPTDLGTVCSVTNCFLPVNLPAGVYQTNGNVTLQGYTVAANRNYVFLIGGNLIMQGQFIIPQGTASTALFSTGGNITVAQTVGTAANATQTTIDGFYSTDRSFIINSTGTCPDLRLNIGGAIVTNAALGGGSFQNNRDLCGDDGLYPTVSITQRLDFLLNAPSFLSQQSIVSQEVAP